MEEKKKIKVSLSLLIIILFIVIVMVIGFYIYQKNIKNNLNSNDEIVEDYSNQELEESLYEESNRVGIVEIVKENNKYGIINSETKEVILKTIYDEIKIEDIGIIKARIENEIKEGVVNTKTGKVVLDVIYEENSFGKWVVEDNYINYYQDGMNGLVDIDKGIVIDAKYEYPVGSFIGKFAIMCEGGAAIMIKNVDSGEEYTYEEFFSNSLAYGKVDEFCLKKDGKVQIVDANTNKVLASTKMDLKELYQVENTNYYIGFDYKDELILFNNKLEIIQKVKLPQGIYTSDSHAEASEEENKIIFNANVYTNEDVYIIDITTGEFNKKENDIELTCKKVFEDFYDLEEEIKSGGSLYALKLLGLVSDIPNEEELEKVTYNEYDEFYKTDIKYSDFKNAICKYITEEFLKNEFEEKYVKNVEGKLQITAMGGTATYIDISDFKLTSEKEYIFNVKGKIRADDHERESNIEMVITFIKDNQEYKISNIEYIDFE